MSFKQYEEVADPLSFPLGDKSYTVEVGLAAGIRLKKIMEQQAADETVDPLTDEEFNRLVLGPTYDQMLKDDVPLAFVARVVLTVLADFQRGREVAEVMWETQANPKALEAYVKARTNRAQRRTKARTTQRPASGTTPTTP